MTLRREVLIGIGNSFRGDDGVGPAVVRAIQHRALEQGWLTVMIADPTQLLDAWSSASVAIVVDALRCDPPVPGRVHRLSAAELPGSGLGTGTHGFGLPDALRLAQELGQAPERLVVFAVEAEHVLLGRGLSPMVAAAVPQVADLVIAELGLSGHRS